MAEKMEDKVFRLSERQRKENAELLPTLDFKLERLARRQNVIIRGVDFNGKTLKKEVEDFLREKLNVRERIKKVSILGKSRNMNNNINTGTLVQMESLEDKRKIMRNRKQLKGTRIFIHDDLTRNEREIHKEIWNHAKKEIAKGKSVKKRIYEADSMRGYV